MRASLFLVALALGGCAKFPRNGARANATRFSVTYTLRTPPEGDRYLYIVAFRVIREGDSQVQSNGPIPVQDAGNKSGLMEGWPTHYVIYTPNTPDGYTVHRFGLKTQFPDPEDTSDNPINFGVDQIPPELAIVSGTGLRPPVDGVERRLEFDITSDALESGDATVDDRKIIGIHFNILTMNKPALGSASGRIYDALGDQRSVTDFNTFQKYLIVSTQDSNDRVQSGKEPSGVDTVGGTLPPIDIVDWTFEIKPP